MDRDSLEEIATLAEEDKIDILGVWKLDRLTRASPWETLIYLNRLREAGVILYADTHGYFEWDDLYDFEILARRVAFAREWYQRIIEGGREGQLELLEEEKWPFGAAPLGYSLNEDQEISLTETGQALNSEIARLYLEHQNMAKVHREVKDNYEDIDVSKAQIANILENPILVGHLTLEGQVVAVDANLQVISREKFQEIQEIREERSSSPSSTRDIPESLDRAAFRFGAEYILGLIDSIGTQCRECGGSLRSKGETKRWGTTLRNYVCTNDECGYEGPLLNQKEFDEIHHTLPLRCPYCPGTNQYEVEQRPAGYWDNKFTCGNCGHSFGSDAQPNKIKEALDKPSLAFKWGDSKESTSDNKDTESPDTSTETDSSQQTLSGY